MTTTASRQFRDAYATHRAAEGHGVTGDARRVLPYVAEGRHARYWAVRARTFEQFMRRIVRPMARERGRPLLVADLGAGNGWLSHRVAAEHHRAIALDVRIDAVDGLGAAGDVPRVAGSFEFLPLAPGRFDLVVFNAALHYAVDLATTLRHARTATRTPGCIAILDSPCYDRVADGQAMVAAKHRDGHQIFGPLAEVLLAVPSIEFFTPDTLAAASDSLDLQWQHHRVRYPLWYELRPLVARLRGRRRPSRFDFWTAVVP